MSRIESNKEIIHKSDVQVFDFLSIPGNYENLMPDQVRSFEADQDSAVLDIQGLGKLKLEFIKRESPSYIEMQPVKPVPVEFNIMWNIKSIGDNETEVQAVIEAKLNMFMKPIVEPVMRNLLNTQVSRLKSEIVKHDPGA
ncbi:hypothetical protein GYB22_02835 [bacterium]|nr:hypothetical protein [bacterium]